MPRLIGLAGSARTGKTTAAAFLTECGLQPLSFMGPINLALAFWFGLEASDFKGDSKEQEFAEVFGFSPRNLIQTLGTEWGRSLVHPDVWLYTAWVTLSQARAEYPRQGGDWVGAVFTDVRFENQAQWIRNQGGQIVHIERRDALKVRDHASESGIKTGLHDIVIRNDGTLEEFQHRLADMMFGLRDAARAFS